MSYAFGFSTPNVNDPLLSALRVGQARFGDCYSRPSFLEPRPPVLMRLRQIQIPQHAEPIVGTPARVPGCGSPNEPKGPSAFPGCSSISTPLYIHPAEATVSIVYAALLGLMPLTLPKIRNTPSPFMSMIDGRWKSFVNDFGLFGREALEMFSVKKY